MPSFAYCSSRASWLRCASFFLWSLVSTALDRLAAGMTWRVASWLTFDAFLPACLKLSFHSCEATSFCCGISSPLRTHQQFGALPRHARSPGLETLRKGVFRLRSISLPFSSPQSVNLGKEPQATFRDRVGTASLVSQLVKNPPAVRETWV